MADSRSSANWRIASLTIQCETISVALAKCECESCSKFHTVAVSIMMMLTPHHRQTRCYSTYTSSSRALICWVLVKTNIRAIRAAAIRTIFKSQRRCCWQCWRNEQADSSSSSSAESISGTIFACARARARFIIIEYERKRAQRSLIWPSLVAAVALAQCLLCVCVCSA